MFNYGQIYPIRSLGAQYQWCNDIIGTTAATNKMDLICATTYPQVTHVEYTFNFYNYGNLADFQLFTQA